jgi:hypothetical protein
LVGNPDGDIEKYNWVGCGVFDYILFADVLEHLRDPLTVLKKSAELLYEGGSILISVPNVSHNSIIIDLINNNFEYRELGLLDNTHIHLFARKSLLKMVGDAGLKVVKEMNTRCAVDKTEFGNKLSDVPKEVHQYLNKKIRWEYLPIYLGIEIAIGGLCMEHFYEKIQGWFDYQDLYKLIVNKLPNGSHIVEVGAWKGRSTAYLAVEIINSGKNIKLDVVDLWTGELKDPTAFNTDAEFMAYNRDILPLFKKNLASVLHILTPIQMPVC